MKSAKRTVYLDNNATTPLHPEVQKTMRAAMKNFGNPSSLHAFGRAARNKVEGVRETIAEFIGASPEEIVFVGSGSEANNTVFNLLSCASRCGGTAFCKVAPEIITTRIEHPCVLETAACLEEKGIVVKYLDVDKYGKIDPEKLELMIGEKTVLVSVMAANNEIGTIQDIAAIAAICRRKNCLFHSDAVQAVGKIPMDVRRIPFDYLSFSAHKIYGPKGVGALYVRKGAPFCSFIHGGHQEKGRRAGTENTLGIIGFGRAVELRTVEMADEARRLLWLKERLKAGIVKNIPAIIFNGHPTDALPGTVNVSFGGAEGEAILLYLDLQGIAVSTGSACASGSLDPSHVLIACGMPAPQAHGSIRISMGRDTTKEDIDYVVRQLTEVIRRVRSISAVTNTGVEK